MPSFIGRALTQKVICVKKALTILAFFVYHMVPLSPYVPHSIWSPFAAKKSFVTIP